MRITIYTVIFVVIFYPTQMSTTDYAYLPSTNWLQIHSFNILYALKNSSFWKTFLLILQVITVAPYGLFACLPIIFH